MCVASAHCLSVGTSVLSVVLCVCPRPKQEARKKSRLPPPPARSSQAAKESCKGNEMPSIWCPLVPHILIYARDKANISPAVVTAAFYLGNIMEPGNRGTGRKIAQLFTHTHTAPEKWLFKRNRDMSACCLERTKNRANKVVDFFSTPNSVCVTANIYFLSGSVLTFPN